MFLGKLNKTGRRLTELAAVLLVQQRVDEGVPLVERLLAIAPQYQNGERRYVAFLLFRYAEEMRRTGPSDAADRFEARAHELGFKREQLPAT